MQKWNMGCIQTSSQTMLSFVVYMKACFIGMKQHYGKWNHPHTSLLSSKGGGNVVAEVILLHFQAQPFCVMVSSLLRYLEVPVTDSALHVQIILQVTKVTRLVEIQKFPKLH